MKIIEQFIQSKTPNAEECEDGIFVNDHFIAVIDGATSQSDTRWEGKKSGKVATELLLAKLAELDLDSNAATAMSTLNGAIAEWYKTRGLYDQMQNNPTERCIASLVVYSKRKNQLWFLGDCQALIDGSLHENNKLVDIVTSNARAMFIDAVLIEGKTITDFQEHDSGRDFILPLLEKQMFFQNIERNSEFKYEVLDGFFEDTDAIKIINIPSATKEIVLASDGYPTLTGSLTESEEALKDILAEDPLLFRKYKSTKGLRKGNYSSDDRSFIRFKL